MTVSMKNNITKVFAIIAFIAAIGVVSWLVNERGEKVQKAMDAYEKCVETEYGRTPSSFYQEHGEYPECVSTDDHDE